ncbi:hypothetical protein GCM10027514_04700 [Azotobacter armeniacus]
MRADGVLSVAWTLGMTATHAQASKKAKIGERVFMRMTRRGLRRGADANKPF